MRARSGGARAGLDGLQAARRGAPLQPARSDEPRVRRAGSARRGLARLQHGQSRADLELGADPDALYATFEHEPFAAASTAQVHRATLPDGRLASGSGDGRIGLWDVQSGAETARLEGHSRNVAALCVLPDGRLASASHDNTIRLWDVQSGAESAREIVRFEIDASVSYLIALPDGHMVVGDAGGQLHYLKIVD